MKNMCEVKNQRDRWTKTGPDLLNLDEYKLFIYWVTHKGWDCKDDLNSLKYHDLNVKISLLPWKQLFNGLFNDLWRKEIRSHLQESINIRNKAV